MANMPVFNYADYLAGVRSPLDTTIKGIQAIQGFEGLKNARAQREALEAQKAQALAMQNDLTSLSQKVQNKSVKPEDFGSVMTKYPAVAQQLKMSLDTLNEDQKRDTQDKALKVFSALSSGQVGIAKDILQEQITAAENSGDEKSKNALSILQKTLEVDPSAAMTSTGLTLFSTMGEKEFSTVLQKMMGFGKGSGYEGNVGAFVSDRVQEANDIAKELTGKPLSNKEIAKLRPKAALEWKRAQAEEVAKNTIAKDIATAQNAEVIAYNKQLGQELAKVRTAYDLLKAKGEITPMESTQKAKVRMTTNLATMVDNYIKLDELGGMINVENNSMDNIWARAKSLGWAQAIQNAMGTDEQLLRNSINNIKPILIQDIRQSTNMSARGLDSEKELEFYLKAVTSEKSDLQSNIATALLIDRAYGDGKLYSQLEPKLSAKTKQFLNDSLKEGQAILNGRDMKPEEKAKAVERLTKARMEMDAEDLAKLQKEQAQLTVPEEKPEVDNRPSYLKELGL